MPREPSKTARHFSRQAQAYANSRGHAADADLDIIVAFSEPGLYDVCLDVATGPGHTAMRIASRSVIVVGIDIAEGMLATARRLATERGLYNASFQFGDAADLPFGVETFDLVTCRIAPHHFEDVPGFLREAQRVLKPGGRFVLEDSLAPEDPAQADFLHRLEVRRDPTHVRSLSRDEWREAVGKSGLTVTRETIFEKRHPMPEWLTRAGMTETQIAEVQAELLAADPLLRDAFFKLEGDRISEHRDHKLILRADKAAR